MSSAVPDALNALATILAPVLPGVEVTVGPNYDPGGDYLCIGWVDEANPGVTVAQHPGDAALRQDSQIYEIHCAIAVHRGDESLQAAIAEAYGYQDGINTALKLNQTLTGAVARAVMGHSNLLLSWTEKGRMAALRFVIHVRAWK